MLEMAKVAVGMAMGRAMENGKCPNLKSLTRSIAALGDKFSKFSLPNDDDKDESSEEEE
jgi:hypothetical protein